MTSAVWRTRTLGVLQEGEVQTNTLWVVTGNNLTLGRDELTRMTGVRLVKAPGLRRYSDVLAHATRVRTSVIRDVVGIVAGYLKASADSGLRTVTRFVQWDQCVRQPLLWAAGENAAGDDWDLARVFEKNEAGSEEASALGHVLHVLGKRLAGRRFSAGDVVDLVRGTEPAPFDDELMDELMDERARGLLGDALETMGCRDSKSSKSVGRVLTGNNGRAATHPDLPGVTLCLRRVVERGKFGAQYVVEKISGAA